MRARTANGSTEWPPARVLALVVAVLFALAPLAVGLALLPGEELTWQMVALIVTTIAGSVLLLAGVQRWFGAQARQLRLAGFLLLLLASLGSVSLAFIFVPLALLTAMSLRRYEQTPARRHKAS